MTSLIPFLNLKLLFDHVSCCSILLVDEGASPTLERNILRVTEQMNRGNFALD